jgi:hypothetical protein
LAGQITMIIISLSMGGGRLYPAPPQLVALCKSEIAAVILQTILTGLIGVVFAAGSVVFEIEKWSIIKQCLVHFAITTSFWLPISYYFWTSHTTISVISCCASFLGTYIIIWLIQYFVWRNNVKKINEKLGEGK